MKPCVYCLVKYHGQPLTSWASFNGEVNELFLYNVLH